MNLRRIGIILFVLTVISSVALQYAYRYIALLEGCQKPNGFDLGSSTPPSSSSVSSTAFDVKRVLCVGGTSGIGYAVALAYLQNNSNVQVVLVGRKTPVIQSEYAQRIKFVPADLSSTKAARQTADKFKRDHFDVILFTVGLVPDSLSRTSEGLELDLAVSYLSRHVMLERMIDHGILNGSRVFIMGYAGLPVNPSLSDINWEQSYSFIPAHLNTHIFNEGLVHYYAKTTPSASFFGLAPGLILSDGFKGHLGGAANFLSGFLPDQDEYASKVLLPLFKSPYISSGSLYNNQGKELNPGPFFVSAPFEKAKEIVDMINALLARLGLR